MGKKDRRSILKQYPMPDINNVIGRPIPGKVGIVSDTHLGSMLEKLDSLEGVYDDFEKRGVELVLHAGDLVDGENVYRGHDRYVKEQGYEMQAQWAIKKYPAREGVKTLMISGNHDNSFFIKSGADIVKYVCSYRDDLEYLGMYYARLKDGIELDILHPRSGNYYSKSYGVQKWIRNNEMPSTYPDIMVFGHWHQHAYFNDHEIDCLMAGNFQGANEYHIRNGFNAPSGGWVLELEREKDKLYGIKLEWRGKK